MKDTPFDRARAHDVRERLFEGRGVVRVWNLLAEPNAPFTAVLACELDPGASVGPHVQERDAEIVVGVEGAATARIDGDVHVVSPGTVLELPLGHTLALENASLDAPFRYLIVKARQSAGP